MGRIEYKRIVKLNWQFDKMSRLEFVATQFGVKFSVMYNLQLHVDKTASDIYMICFYFENFAILQIIP